MKQKRIASVSAECVACGNCVNYCPLNAIAISRGIRAAVDAQKCVGCGRCETACPAGVISLSAREAEYA